MREASSGVVLLIDGEGNVLGDSRYFGRLPEANKLSLKAKLYGGLAQIKDRRAELKLLAIEDAAKDKPDLAGRVGPGLEPDRLLSTRRVLHYAEYCSRPVDTVRFPSAFFDIVSNPFFRARCWRRFRPDQFRFGGQLQQVPDRTRAEAVGPVLGVGRRPGGADDPLAGEVRALRPRQPNAAEYRRTIEPVSTRCPAPAEALAA